MPPRKGYKKRKGRKTQRSRKMTLYRNPNSGAHIHVMLRSTGTQTLTGTTTVANSTFTLDSFQIYSNFTQLYEQYRIKYIKQVIYPCNQLSQAPHDIAGDATMGDGTVTSVVEIPLICWKVDRDDVTGFSNLDDVLKNPKAKVRRGDKVVKIGFKPNLLTNVYGSVADNNSIVYDRWLETEDSSDTGYYGLCKLFHAPGASSTYPLKFRIITTAYCEFKAFRSDE